MLPNQSFHEGVGKFLLPNLETFYDACDGACLMTMGSNQDIYDNKYVLILFGHVY